MGTSSKVLERTEQVAKAVALENSKDFKPNVSVSAGLSTDRDPMKFSIQVYWAFHYNGESCLSLVAVGCTIRSPSSQSLRLLFTCGGSACSHQRSAECGAN